MSSKFSIRLSKAYRDGPDDSISSMDEGSVGRVRGVFLSLRYNRLESDLSPKTGISRFTRTKRHLQSTQRSMRTSYKLTPTLTLTTHIIESIRKLSIVYQASNGCWWFTNHDLSWPIDCSDRLSGIMYLGSHLVWHYKVMAFNANRNGWYRSQWSQLIEHIGTSGVHQ